MLPQLGFGELVVIFIVALLVWGPKKLPDLGKSLGKGLREFRKATDELKSNWEEQVRDADRSTEDVRQTIQEVKVDLDAVVVDSEETPKPADTSEEIKPDVRPN